MSAPALTPSLARELAGIVGARHVLTGLADRLAYNNDCWPRGIILTRGQQVQHHLPAAIVQPADEAELVRLVELARRTSTPIVPYGAGSGVCGGAITDGEGIIVDLKRLDRMTVVRDEDLMMRAQAGVIGMNMERELERRGLTLGHYPSSLLCSSVGGYLAARSAGQYSSRYGKIEDMVASMRVITGAGQVIETAPDPCDARPLRHAAPGALDLTQLMVGSEGTLGLITEASLYLHVRPQRRWYRGFMFRGVDVALGAIRELMQQGARPAVVRLYDAFDTLVARRTRQKRAEGDPGAPGGELLDAVRGWFEAQAGEGAVDMVRDEVKQRVDAIARGLLSRVLGQPLWLNRAVDALPDDCMLILGFEGDGPLVEEEARLAFELMGRRGLDLGAQPGEHWLKNRYGVSYKQSSMYAAGAFVDTMEVSTTWANLENLYWSVRRAMAPHVFVMAHFSHVYPEGSSIYFTFAGYGADLDDTLRRYDQTWRAGLSAVADAGGSIAHHHGVGQSKAPWTARDHPGGRRLFDALKATFDPDGIMNPGKVYTP